ncbi:MAG: PQQ-binding-like beta-propeller repeat protein [Bacteroidota bacterium]|nr:PQQ-binding-like beta-propeller repeat protein [Bacteroidota bacterium]
MANGNPERSSSTTARTPRPPLTSAAVIENVRASQFVVVDGVLYASRGGTPNSVVAFDIASGSALWHFDIPGTKAAVDNVPAVAANLVLCGGQGGAALHALDRTTGELVWQVPTSSLYARNTIIDGTAAYVCSDSILCVELADGSTRWRYPLRAQTTPTVDDAAVYVDGASQLLALDKVTGQQRWSISAREQAFGHVVVDGQRLYVSDGMDVRCVDKRDGSVVWTVSLPDLTWISQLATGCFALGEDVLCVAPWEDTTGTTFIVGLDKNSGTQLWRHDFDGPGLFTPTVVGNTVYVVSWEDAILWGFDISSGDVLCHRNDGAYYEQPIAAEGKLFVKDGSAVRVFTESPTHAADVDAMPGDLSLDVCPNPAFGPVVVTLATRRRATVSLRVFDVLGRHVGTLFEGMLPAGTHQFNWSASGSGTADGGTGMYLIAASTAELASTRRLFVVR